MPRSTSPSTHSEAAFEKVIEDHLLAHGYVQVTNPFDRTRALFPDRVIDFIHTTQPKEWAKLEALHGENTATQILTDLCNWLNTYGALHTLRHGFKCYGRILRIAYFKAAHSLNPELETRYAANCVGITRQLHYSDRDPAKSLDVTLSLNGIPLVTLELKNPITGQTFENAKHQYRQDRDPRELFFQFKQRTLVHFAVDTEEVWMTTRLAGDATHFLPFNQGCDGGAGNPADSNGRSYRTAYLWEKVLQRDSFLDLLARFLHIQIEEKRDEDGRKFKKESLIFPRYHQLQAVRQLTEADVLDFVNDREETQNAFQQFYDGAEIGEEAKPEQLYKLQAELDAQGIYRQEDIDQFCAIYFKPKERQSAADHQAMNAALDPAVDRFRTWYDQEPDEADIWRRKIAAFRNLYAFLSQVIPYQDSDLEKLYIFLRHLSPKLPRRKNETQYDFDNDVQLEYYRLQKISEGSIDLKKNYRYPLDGPKSVGTGVVRESAVKLSQLIDTINSRFGTDFNQADQLFFDQIVEAATSCEELQEAAQSNSVDKFALLFKQIAESLFIERVDQNEAIFARYMNDQAFQSLVSDWLASEVYRRATHNLPDRALYSADHPSTNGQQEQEPDDHSRQKGK
jgi:hypothetical protein